MANKNIRKDISHMGGYIADYMNTELLCRSKRWVKQHTVVCNGSYRALYDCSKEILAIAEARIDEFDTYSPNIELSLIHI